MKASQRNNVHVLGTGDRVLMFAHGYGCDQSMWRHVYPSFLDTFKVVLFDYVGSGSSDTSAFDPTRYSTLNGYASDVLEILHELGIKRVNFIGHSVSSMIGALAANREPDLFESLVMIGPSPSYINHGDYIGGFSKEDIDGLLSSLESNHMAWAATMAPAIMGNPETPELAGELEASFCRMDPMLAQHFARVTFLSDNRADLPHIRTRTLILQCEKDMIASATVGEYVHQCISGSQYAIMNATGHCPHMSAPKEVVREMQSFLQTK
jgi:sigma-B regulation protein RsbQ